MELDGLPQLTCLWNKDPHGILGLQSLQYLTIKKCSLLRNLFTCSTAMALQQLKVLYLESCPVMEEVIGATEDGHRERVVLKRCPKMHNFTFGQVRMLRILVSTRGDEGLQTKDLNKYLEEQLLKGEECATVDENDYDGKEEKFSNLYGLRE
ncbi:hypothetical protein CsSME_00018746 [Camellia sinensis var. sinensis]